MTPARSIASVLVSLTLFSLADNAVAADPIAGLTIQGEKFTLDDGTLKFSGILQKPTGKGPFPALLISHGLGGSAERFGGPKCREFVKRGFVCLAPEYTHSNPRG